MLNWSSHDHIDGTVTAVGQRGVYSLEQVGGAWSLQGSGHDGLSIPGLPAGGQAFARLDYAKSYASKVDAAPPEGLAGGE